MKAVKVEYTVRPEFLEQNKANIKKVMGHIKMNPIDGMLYSTFTKEDGLTFVHINISKDQKTLDKINEVQEFIEFKRALKESNPIESPKSTKLDLVAAGFGL